MSIRCEQDGPHGETKIGSEERQPSAPQGEAKCAPASGVSKPNYLY